MPSQRLLRAALAVLVLCACEEARPATQVRVFIDAEPLVRAEAATLRYVVRGGDAEYPVLPIREERELAEFEFPFDVTVAPIDADAARIFELEATALDVVGVPVARVRVRMGYSPGQTREIRLLMQDSCRGIICDDTLTCRDAQCVAPDPPPEVDAGVPGDAGVRPPCSSSAECDDGVFCNGSETCTDGVCVPGERVDCSDHFDCTEDRCELTGCVHTPVSALCTAFPGGVCDVENGCQYGPCTDATCVGGPCERAFCEGDICRRYLACDEGQMCCGGECVPAGCEDGNPCTAGTCNRELGRCDQRPRAFACSDGDRCTERDTCVDGTCRGTPTTCMDDGNACTAEMCTATGGCQSVQITGPCSDADACTVGDTCAGGTCQPGPRMSCDDGIPCTVDSCAGGTCTNTPNNSLCPVGATCNVAMRACVFTAMCDAAACAASAGPCQTGTCSGSSCIITGGCTAPSVCCGGACMNCDDGNPCTTDSCGGGGCMHVNRTGSCDDGMACTSADMCVSGVCRGTPTVCNDSNQCTTDSCNPATGACSYVAVSAGTSCDDGNMCTINDACSGTTCMGVARTCADTLECTTDSCNPATGCVFTPRADGSSCGGIGTGCDSSTCQGGFCVLQESCPPPRLCCFGSCQFMGSPECL